MTKFLRLVVVLILVFAAAAAWMEYRLYQNRGPLKERTQKLEMAARNLTTTLTAAKEPHVEAIDRPIDAAALMDPDRMETQLRILDVLTDNRIDEIVVAKGELDDVTRERDSTKEDLARVIKDVDTAQEELAPLAEKVKAKDAEVVQANARIVELEGEIDNINQRLEALRESITRMESDKVDMRDEIRRLEIELVRYRSEMPDSRMMSEGLTGKIVAINPEFEFVVLDLGKKEGLVPDARMLVHREDQLIGRVRIADVHDTMAIADIEPEWVKDPLQKDDDVLY